MMWVPALWTTALASVSVGTFAVEINPPSVTVDLKLTLRGSKATRDIGRTNTTAAQFKGVKITPQDTLILDVAPAGGDYAPLHKEYDLGYAEGHYDRKKKELTISEKLERIRQRVPVELATEAGADVLVSGEKREKVTELVFAKDKPGGKWLPVTIKVTKQGFEPATNVVEFQAVQSPTPQNGPCKISMPLESLTNAVSLEILCNQSDAQVYVDEKLLGKTVKEPATLRVAVIYDHARAADPWPKRNIRIVKPGFEIPAEGEGEPLPHFEKSFTPSEALALKGRLEVNSFAEVKFYLTPLRQFEIDNVGVRLVTNSVLSAVQRMDVSGNPAPIEFQVNNRLPVVSRLAAGNKPGQLIFTMARLEFSQPDQPPKIVGANIVMLEGETAKQITDESGITDLDPCISPDGKFYYYSRDAHKTKRAIYKLPTDGSTGETQITFGTDTMDFEPAVSKDNRLAFSARTVNAPPNFPPNIMVEDPNDHKPAFMEKGHSPAWSPSGDRLVFVNEHDKLAYIPFNQKTMAREPTVNLDSGSGHAAYPAYDTLGQVIYYVSDQEVNERKRPHFDIYKLNLQPASEADRKPVRLTQNGSFDYSPAIDSDGKFLYFFTNRGAVGTNQFPLAIYRISIGL